MSSIFFLLLATATAPAKEISSVDIHRYLWANYQQLDNKLGRSRAMFDLFFKRGGSHYGYKGYVHLLKSIGAYPTIAYLLPHIEHLFTADNEMRFIFVQALSQVGRKEEAEERIIRLSFEAHDNPTYALNAIQIYASRNEVENALIVIDNFLNTGMEHPNQFIFHFLKAQLHLHVGDRDRALQSVKRTLEMNPHFDGAHALHAMINNEHEEKTQAVIQGNVVVPLKAGRGLAPTRNQLEWLLPWSTQPTEVK